MILMKDFSKIRKPVVFTIDEDTFRGVPGVPAVVFVNFMAQAQSLGEDEDPEKYFELNVSLLKEVLDVPSFETFHRRINDRDQPIEVDQVNDVTMWLMDEYGMRPTEAPPSSSDGPSALPSGPNSTVRLPAEESTFSPSPSINSSMPSTTSASSV